MLDYAPRWIVTNKPLKEMFWQLRYPPLRRAVADVRAQLVHSCRGRETRSVQSEPLHFAVGSRHSNRSPFALTMWLTRLRVHLKNALPRESLLYRLGHHGYQFFVRLDDRFRRRSPPREITENSIFTREEEMSMCSIFPKEILDLTIDLFHPRSVLDVGCGTGISLDYFKTDLNAPVTETLKNRFTAVVDGGCLEHIFNFPQAIKNCMQMLQVGGHFLGITPANNFCGHGFYQFSPELYFRIFSGGKWLRPPCDPNQRKEEMVSRH